MQLHWKVLAWMVAGVLVGVLLQTFLEAPAWAGARWLDTPGPGIELEAGRGPAEDLPLGKPFESALRRRGTADEERRALDTPEDFDALLADCANGEVVWLEREAGEPLPLTLGLDPDSWRATAIAPFAFVADIFLALLKMLIVPIVFTSIVSGVSGIGSGRDLGRLGAKTFAYYVTTSLLAICIGQLLVNLVQPGKDAALGLSPLSTAGVLPEASFVDVLKRMVPQNIFGSLSDNGAMLSVIFFALLFGFFITRVDEPHRSRVTGLFESLFEVVMRLAQGILKLIPYGVFALLVEVVARTGFSVFPPLLKYMLTVAGALVFHACVTLPLFLRWRSGVSPRQWFRAMSPALMTAFSTSSSSMTLPVTLETVEQRGRVSNKVTSFTLPLGATINMDGTALYECIGVIFLAQYYASTSDYDLTLGAQAMVVVMALLASVGAAGIPSAGLVMMLTILSALKLPLEGAALLLAVDRPLDMMRTVVNVWSDSCGAAVVARSEGEEGPLHAGAPAMVSET